MKSMFRFLTLLAFFYVAVRTAVSAGSDRDIVFQTAPFQSLSVGVYDGLFSFAALKEHGDFGLGTFNGLDGEMVCVDNAFYQVKQDGKVVLVSAAALTPFAMVTFFDEDQRIEAVNVESLSGLRQTIDRCRPTKNLFYALRVDGVFDYIKVRSVPAQKKPYCPLADAVKGQTVFEYKNIPGTLVGFWSPSFADKVSVPGYHFHFISTAKGAGGHVLDLQVEGARIQIDKSHKLLLELPESEEFLKSRFEGDTLESIAKVEK